MSIADFQTFTFSLDRGLREFTLHVEHDFGFYVDPQTGETLADTTLTADLQPYAGVFAISGGGSNQSLAVLDGFAVDLADGTYRLSVFGTETWQGITITADVDVTIKLATAGNATLGADFENIFYGGDGADVVAVAARLDGQPNRLNVIHTGGGGDQIFGGNGFDRIYGEAGNDTLIGGSDALTDLLVGGADNDTYALSNGFDTVQEILGGGTDTVETIISRTLTSYAHVENLTLFSNGQGLNQNINGTGNSLVNTITGNPFNNILDGGVVDNAALIDTLRGGSGDDTYILRNGADTVVEIDGGGTDTITTTSTRSLASLAFVENLKLEGTAAIGGTGNARVNRIEGNGAANTLDGGSNADTMLGGNGNDTYVVDNAGDVVTETNATAATGGTDRIFSGVTRTLGANVEELLLTGAAAVNATGNALDNYLLGNGASNVLRGLDGADRLNGSAGIDYISGGAGIDLIAGGADRDYFYFDVAIAAGANRDYFTDFSVADDTFMIENGIYTALGATTGALAAAKFWSSATGLAHDADDRITYNTSNGYLYYDTNGNVAGGSTLIAVLQNRPALTAADIYVI